MSRATRLDSGRGPPRVRASFNQCWVQGGKMLTGTSAGRDVSHKEKRIRLQKVTSPPPPPLNISMQHKSGGCIKTQLRAADSGYCSSADRLWPQPLNEVLSWSRSRIRRVFKSAVCSIDLFDERWIQTSISNRAFWGSGGKKPKP